MFSHYLTMDTCITERTNITLTWLHPREFINSNKTNSKTVQSETNISLKNFQHYSRITIFLALPFGTTSIIIAFSLLALR